MPAPMPTHSSYHSSVHVTSNGPGAGTPTPHYYHAYHAVHGYQADPMAPVTMLGGQSEHDYPRSWPQELMAYRFPTSATQPMPDVPWYERMPAGMTEAEAGTVPQYYIPGVHGHYSPKPSQAMPRSPPNESVANGHGPANTPGNRRSDSGMADFEI